MEITKKEYLQALEIVHKYTVQQIQLETICDDTVVIESRRINAIHEKVREILGEEKYERSRRSEKVFKRRALMWWLRQNTVKSYREISMLIGNYNHSTIVHACRKHQELYEVKDRDYIEYCEEIFAILEPYKKQ